MSAELKLVVPWGGKVSQAQCGVRTPWIHKMNRKATLRMNELLDSQNIASVVGVIDCSHGIAVHAIAGNRADYQPIAFAPDPIQLAKIYHGMGLRSLYLADLDALIDASPQTKWLQQFISALSDHWDELLIDIGWSEGEIALGDLPNHVRIVAATESARSLQSVDKLRHSIAPNQIVLGLDYRGGKFISPQSHSSQVWIDHARNLGVTRALVLDIATVGTDANQKSLTLCEQVKQMAPDFTVYGGGGIRSASDLSAMLAAGCEKCLIATSLLKIASDNRKGKSKS